MIVENDANSSLNNFLSATNEATDKHAPPRKLTKSKFKQKYKPWTTKGIVKSIEHKNKLFNKYLRFKDPAVETTTHNEYKELKNKIGSIIYVSKKSYYKKYFQTHNDNAKKIWTGIKGIIDIKSQDFSSPSLIEVKNEQITDNIEISNNFNTYFSNIAEKILNENKTPILKYMILS